MNVEDSYEGAVRRLRRLEMAAIDVAPPPSVVVDDGADRMSELEELATLACEDNERLTRELAGARYEIERLRGIVTTLQQTLAGTDAGEDVVYPPRSRGKGAAFYFFVIMIIGAGAAALLVLRPWDRPRAVPVVVEPVAIAAPPPVVTAPAPAPKIEPVAPKVEPTIPKAAPVAAAAPAAAVNSRPQRRHAKHHAASSRHERKKSAAHAKESAVPDTDDPLGGVNL